MQQENHVGCIFYVKYDRLLLKHGNKMEVLVRFEQYLNVCEHSVKIYY